MANNLQSSKHRKIAKNIFLSMLLYLMDINKIL